MSPGSGERKLAAILAADAVAYSRVMGADEEGTLVSLNSHRREVFDPLIARHRGKIVKTTGDGLLSEFQSVVEAVRCAVAIQKGMAERNRGIAADRRLDFRIGIHVGDVVEQNGDIFGDGVNIAARLEGIAEPGGIFVSARVQEDAVGKVEVAFDDLGEHALKNINRAIRVYRARLDQQPDPGLSTQPESDLSDRPSIAVLPFNSMSSDRELEFFADGISEEIITALSRVPDLLVAARNSAFGYKGRAMSVPKAAEELRVKYILEGSVRAAGNRVRVTAQLIEGASGQHVWAERYDGELDDIFQVQDDITRNIASALQVKLTYGESARLWDGRTDNLTAWAKMVEGRKLSNKYNRPDILAARRLFEEAVAIDPNYGGALVHLGLAHWWEARYALEIEVGDALTQAEEVIRRLESIRNHDESSIHYLRGYIAFIRRDCDTAIREIGQAGALSPSDTWIAGVLGQVYIFAGQPQEALRH